MTNQFAVHLNAIWRDQADFVIHAKCVSDERESLNPKYEQLWTKRITDNSFLVCCIPFFIYDLALGDEVETGDDEERQYVVKRVIKPSGHYTFRVWFGSTASANIRIELPKEIAQLGCLFEWSSANLLAIDASSDQQANALAALLQNKEQADLLVYETGRSR